MGGSILDRAYEDERNAALDQELDALLNDPAYGTPKPELAPAATPEAADLWSDGPDRKDRIRKASEDYISKWASGEVQPEMANKPVDLDRVKTTAQRLGKVFEALGPAYDKLGTDMEAFFIENPAGIPGGNPLDAEDESYSAMVGAFGPYIQGLIQEPFNPAGAIDRVSKEQVTKDERLAKANRNSSLKAAMINARMPVGDSDIEQGLYDATFSLGQTLPALVAGIATKNPYLAASMMGGQTTMGSYGDARRAGADKGKAWRYGLGMGTIEAATEFLPTKFFLGDVAARSGFVETFAKQAAADGVGEQAATVGQSLLTWAELNPDKPFSEFVGGLPEEMKRTFYASIWQSSIMSGAQQGLAQIGKPKEEGGTEDPEGTPAAAEPEAAAPEAPAEGQDTQAAPDQAGQDGEADNAFLKSVDAIVGAVQAAEQKEAQQVTEPRVDPEAAFLDDVNRLFGMPAAPVPAAPQTEVAPEEAAPAVDITVLRDEAEATLDRALETESSEDISAAVSAYNALMEKTGGAQIDPENPLPENPTPEEREAFVAQVEQAIEEAPPTPAEEAISKVVDEVRAEAPASRYFGRKSFGGEGLATEAPAPEAAPVARTSAKYEVETEDSGSFELTIIRLPDGSVGLIGPDINVNYVPAFAKGKTDQELMAYQFEPLGFKQATDKAGRAAAPPARLPPKPAISEAELARIGEQETARSRAVTRREDMAEKAETVYDDILTKPVLELLNDEFNMTERQVRDVMGKAIDGLGAIDRFNTIMKRYAKVKARLDREAAQQPQVQDDFAALVDQQPDPGEGGLGRGMQSLLDEQGVDPNTKFSRSDAKTRMENAEKNRKKLDYAAWLRWGEAYLEMIRTGDLSFATADDLESMGLPGDINAVSYTNWQDGKPPETIINMSVAKPSQMDGLILHEIGVHRGLQGLMGKGADQVFARLESILTTAADKQQQGLRLSSTEKDVIAARQHAIRNAADPSHITEETLAYLVENYVYNPFVPDLITNMKVWIGRKFPGVIDRLGWGSKEFRQLAVVSTRKFVESIIYKPALGLKGGRSRRAPLELDIRYPQDFKKRARGMGVKGLWRMVRELDLRDVNAFAQNVANIEDELTSPEVIRALFDVVPNFDFPAYQDQITATKAGDPDAAFDLTETLTRLKGMDLPVDVKFSAGDGRRAQQTGYEGTDKGEAVSWVNAIQKGLDMSTEARMARAEDMGFDTSRTLYHGTNGDIQAFDLDRSGSAAGIPGERAIFLSSSPEEASVYARNASVAANGPGAFGRQANIRGSNVMPLLVRPGKQMVVDRDSHPELLSSDGSNMLYNANAFADIITQARADGFNTILFKDVLDSGKEPADQIAVLDPSDLRSVHAAFDPDQSASPRIMFSRNIQPDPPRPEDGVPPSVQEIYFNWMRFGGPENTWNSVRESLKDAAVSDRMGPAITHEQVALDAEHANAFNAFLKSRNKDALSLEEVTALRYLHKYASLKVWELAQIAEANPSDKKAEVAFMRASNFLTMVTAEVKGQSAQASRALSIWRIQARSTAAISAAVDQMVNDPNQTKTLRKMIKDISNLDAKEFGKLNKRVEMSNWKAWQELAGTWVRAMFLSHFPTHVVNAMGNLMVMQGSVADHFMGGLITADMDLIEEAQVRQAAILEGFLHQFEYMKANSQINPLKANPSLAFDPGEVPTDNKFVEGSRDRALSAARLEKLSFGLIKNADEKSGIGHLAEVLGYGLAAPSDALGVADDLFKGTNFRVSLRGQAFRKAREERRSGQITEAEEAERAEYLFQNPSPEMIKQGIADAQENTFTRPVGNMTRGALSVRNWLNEKTGIAGWLLLPFVITPSNILSFRFRRMPTAPFFKEWRDAYMRGGKDRAVAIAQVANGTSLMALGGALYAMGVLTGLGPDDPQKRQALMATGWQPLAMKINGQYVNTNRLDPTMMPLHLSAAMAEIMANKSWMADGDERFMELAMQSTVKFGQMMLDKSYLQGLSDVVTAYTSEGNAQQRLGLWFENAIAGATTPAALAAVRRAEDPWRRIAWDQIDRIRNRVPLLSSGLPEDYDDFGRPRGYQSGFGSVYDYASPFAASKIANEPIDQELMRLKYVPSRLSVNVSVPFAGNSIMVNLRAHDRADIYSDMLRLMGGDPELGIPNFREQMNLLVQSEGYQQLGDYNDPNIEGGKAKAIADMHSEFRAQIREVIVGDLYYSDLQRLAAKEFQAKNNLASIREAEQQASEITEVYKALTEEALQP